MVFLDDILVFSSSWQEHLEHLESVLSALAEAELLYNGSKCLYAVQRVKFLGHIITAETVAPDPEKLVGVTKWPVPRSVKEVRQFLGFTNFFRRFIRASTAWLCARDDPTKIPRKSCTSTLPSFGFD